MELTANGSDAPSDSKAAKQKVEQAAADAAKEHKQMKYAPAYIKCKQAAQQQRAEAEPAIT